MSPHIKHQKIQFAKNSVKRCKTCPEVERAYRKAKQIYSDKSVHSVFHDLFSIDAALTEVTACQILKYFSSPTKCPCPTCMLKVCCSEDCAEKIKAMREVSELIRNDNTGAKATKQKKGKPYSAASSMEDIQESLRTRVKKQDKETQKYKRRRK